MKRILFLVILLSLWGVQFSFAGDTARVYVYKIFREIGSTSWVHTQEAFHEAEMLNAKCIILHLNTYGGQVIFADSIRTKILNSKIPVHVFIDNNAASAGALISIACDSIYMRPGANIGAATVVDQSGQQMPDKYQSYMRSTIRATAQAKGKDTIVVDNDTIIRWRRDPHIAEAMVDASIAIAGVIDSGKVLTFTAEEAMKYGYCSGMAVNIKEVIGKLKIEKYEIHEFRPSFFDGLKGFLTSPILQGILILVIIGGIYFELQTPGIGFPILASVVAAVLYFAPLYIDGLAANWEIILFLIGVILLGVEILVLPGFGVAGVLGVVFVVTGLTFSMLDNDWFDFTGVGFNKVMQAMSIVLVSLVMGFILIVYISKRVLESEAGLFAKVALHATQDVSKGYVGVDAGLSSMVGRKGHAATVLRPSGKVLVDSELLDAMAEHGFIEKGASIEVVGISSGQLLVTEIVGGK
ncbi:MAG: NfeD family protein [Breznakibacter sp.]